VLPVAARRCVLTDNNDVVIKTRSHDEFITDLEETFNSMRQFRWKLNLSAFSACHKENYSGSLLVTEELK
jgi:hypothetical protein